MASPNLTAERLRELLHYDPDTGVFTWRVDRCGPKKAGDVAGCAFKGYVLIGVERRVYLAHRLAWLYMNGEWPPLLIDHEDTNGLNNRWLNLRHATRTLNGENMRKANKNNKSGLLGVSPHKDRWSAQIHVGGKKHHLGLFDEPTEAHTAYVDAKRKMHEGCTL